MCTYTVARLILCTHCSLKGKFSSLGLMSTSHRYNGIIQHLYFPACMTAVSHSYLVGHAQIGVYWSLCHTMYAPCHTLYVIRSMSYALCRMLYVICFMSYALCHMLYIIRSMSYALSYVLCHMLYVNCFFTQPAGPPYVCCV